MTRVDCDIAVVGAGIIGLSIAYEMGRRGAAVTMIGPPPCPDSGIASTAAGAMLSIFSETDPSRPDLPTTADIGERLLSDAIWQRWLNELTESGHDIRVDRGTWVVARPDEISALDAIRAMACRHLHPVEEHRPDEIPGLSGQRRGLSDALWLPTESSVDAFQVLSAFHASLRRNPLITWINGTAESLAISDAWKSIAYAGGTVRARTVIVAAGAASVSLLGTSRTALGVPVLFGGRGSGLLVRTPTPPRNTMRTVNRAFSCGTHLVPRAYGLTYVGATNRFRQLGSSGAKPLTTLDEITVLTEAVTSEFDESLFEAEMISAHAGLRQYTVDHLPLVGRTADPGILLATATYRSGYMLAPRIAELIAEELPNADAQRGHVYSVDRTFPEVGTSALLETGSAGLIDALCEPGGHLPPGVAKRLTSFIVESLRMALDGSDGAETAENLRDLWKEAPVAEAIPALLRLVQESRDRRTR